MTHGARMIVRPGVWTGAASEASCRLSCRRRCRRTTASPLAWARASSHAPTRSTKSHLACDVRGDVVHPAVGGIEGHHAQGIAVLNDEVVALGHLVAAAFVLGGDRLAGLFIDELLAQAIAGGLVDLPQRDAL